MTIREHLHKHLCDNGLWPEEATAVLLAAEKHENQELMRGRWDEDTSAYPLELLAVLTLTAERQAVAWLEEHKPLHFALALLRQEPVPHHAVPASPEADIRET